jgi:two-component system phosphate regulon sensor histidine kinase PhoR
MKRTLQKILLTLIIVLFLPLAIGVFYEYTRLNENEQLITTVYKNQLESMVSSINTYSQDVVMNWANRTEQVMKQPDDSALLFRLIDENQSISAMYCFSETGKSKVLFQRYPDQQQVKAFENLLESNQEQLVQLRNYLNNNYRRILTYRLSDQHSLFYFALQTQAGGYAYGFIETDNQQFLNQQLRPKIQEIAQNDFWVHLLHTANDSIFISSQKEIQTGLTPDLKGVLWLIPEIEIAIGLKNETIKNMVDSRVNDGKRLFALMLVLLLAGFWFLYSSIRREIKVTQIKSEFIQNVSHEIRTPLALINMYIETLEMGRVKTREKVQEYYRIISNETNRLTSIVDKILNFSKLENNKRELHFEACDLNQISQQVLDTYAYHLVDKGFRIQFNLHEPLLPVYCDSGAVAEALINLIDNAVKYSGNSREVVLTTGQNKRYVYVEVRDYGMGIAKKHQKLVFDKFYRVTNQQLANQVKGTGLGLALVRETMKNHQGKVSLSSKLNEGSTFRLYFPKYHPKNKLNDDTKDNNKV